jgi:hypothetical protein
MTNGGVVVRFKITAGDEEILPGTEIDEDTFNQWPYPNRCAMLACGYVERIEDVQKSKTKFNKDLFLDALADKRNVKEACESVGVSPATAYNNRNKDKDLASRWEAIMKKED